MLRKPWETRDAGSLIGCNLSPQFPGTVHLRPWHDAPLQVRDTVLIGPRHPKSQPGKLHQAQAQPLGKCKEALRSGTPEQTPAMLLERTAHLRSQGLPLSTRV